MKKCVPTRGRDKVREEPPNLLRICPSVYLKNEIQRPDVKAIGRRVIVVRAFVKKTQKTPPAEIKLALRRAKEIT